MSVLIPLAIVCALAVVAAIGGMAGAGAIFAVAIPYVAIALFLGGFVWRILKWAKAPVPFRITTVCGQQKSLPWIRHSRLDSPFTKMQTFGRMALEVLLFRSLFRNTFASKPDGKRLIYNTNQVLWLAALAFHYAFLVIFIRHYRNFADPIPAPINAIAWFDAFFEIGVPALLLSNVLLVGALTVLIGRRLLIPQLRYISQPADYFPLFLILGIAITGMLMRHSPYKVPIKEVKDLAMGLVIFKPVIPSAGMPLFYAHLMLVSTLFAYFPFSKLMHMGGIFLSPTRNMPNNTRAERHINPWNPEVKTHTYEEWEEEFHDKIAAAGLPLDKDA